MRYQTLLTERDGLIAEGKTLFEAAEKATRDLSEAEKTRDEECRVFGVVGEVMYLGPLTHYLVDTPALGRIVSQSGAPPA